MTRDEVHARFVAIVAKVDAELAVDSSSRWQGNRPIIEGRVMPIKPEYGGNVAIPGNLDGRGGRL